MAVVLGPRWTQLIPKAGESSKDDEDLEGDESAGGADEAGEPEEAADAGPAPASDAPEPPSGARRLTGEPPPLGGRGTPKPTPRTTRRHAAQPAPAPRPEQPAAEAPPVWEPEPTELPKSAEPISNAKSRPADRDDAYAKPRPIPRRARPSRLGQARVRASQRVGARIPKRKEHVAEAHSAGLESGVTRERDVFEIASMVFGAIIVFFGLWGAIATIGGGVGSAGFVISIIFTALGAGRLYYGFRGHRPVGGA